MILWSSKCPAGIRRAPSGLKVGHLKKFVTPSSPYSLTLAQDGVANRVQIAGSGGIRDGDQPTLSTVQGSWYWKWMTMRSDMIGILVHCPLEGSWLRLH